MLALASLYGLSDEDHEPRSWQQDAEQPGVQHEPISVPFITGVVRLTISKLFEVLTCLSSLYGELVLVCINL